jgi:hypothetical protein
LLKNTSTVVKAPCVKGKACCYLKQATGKIKTDPNAVATGTFVQRVPKPPQPHIAAGYETYNIFWPYDSDANGTVYACTYLPTLVLANHTRLIAHGSCGVKDESCGGFHHGPPHGAFVEANPRNPLSGNPISEGMICQKHSDDGGKTWSRIRVVARGVMTGQVLWDDVRKVLIMHSGAAGRTSTTSGNYITERRSHDLGETWNTPRNMSFLLDQGELTAPSTALHTLY